VRIANNGLEAGRRFTVHGERPHHEESQWVSTSTTSRPRSCPQRLEQRIAVETDPEALAVMRDAQGEEFKHFSMDLEFLLRRSPAWREIAQGVLFKPGDIVEHGESAEAATLDGNGAEGEGGYPAGSLGIGSLRGALR
jgi:uncharacterized protein